MSDNLSLRMTIDVCVFAETKGETLAKVKLLRDGTGDVLTPRGGVEGGSGIDKRVKLHQWGVGEAVAREVMAAIKRGDIEIDDIRDIEDHT